MTLLRTLRKLLLGETWALPLGVLVVLVAGLVLEQAAGGWWRDVGGFVLLAGVLATLSVAVARSGER